MHTLLLGKHNPKLLALRKSIREADVTPDGLLPIEGRKLLDEAARSGIEVMDVFIRRGVDLPPIPEKANVYELDAATFKSIQSTESSQGVIALVRPRSYSVDSILSVANPKIVVLGRLQDPGNVGAILRVAESFYATGCLALTGTASVHNSKTVRASAGSVFRLPHVWNLELNDVVQRLKTAGLTIVGTSPTATRRLDTWTWQQPLAFVVGNEGGGLSDDEMKHCDVVLRIPQNPAAESLNSAIAAAILLYEATRR